ncbi:MAG: helix-turn-helix transcriptional regulator [Bacteroidales bacterium]|nr:helix-turn-helix transcriptional regulator [Candidatus Cacconaster merdequi]
MADIKWASDSEVLTRIGQKVKEWRLEMNLSQKELSEKAQLSSLTIQQVEYGKGTSVRNLLHVLRVLDRLDFFELFFQEKQLSPVEYERMMKIHSDNERKRASSKKNKEYDTDTDNAPLW